MEGGWVRIQKAGIAAVGSGRAPSRPGEELREFPDAVLIPALVNGHAHLEYGGDPVQLFGGGFAAFLKSMKEMRQERTVEQTLATLGQNAERMRNQGVGTVLDHLSVGPPGKVALPISDPYPGRGRFVPAFEILGGFQESWALPPIPDRHPLAARNPGWAPHSTYLCGEEVFRQLGQGPAKAGLISVHVAESYEEEEMWGTGAGVLLETLREWVPSLPNPASGGPLGPLRRAGLLGPRTILVHGNYLSAQEIVEAGRLGSPVVHCPSSHSFFKHKRFPWQALSQAGCPILVGTDSSATGGAIGLAENLRLGLETSDAAPRDLWLAATRGGAEALGLGGLTASLRAGYSADLALLNAPGASLPNLAEKMLEGSVLGGLIQGSPYGALGGMENPA